MDATKWTTILGFVQAAGVGVADFLAHTSMDGGALHQPTFWLGLVIAAAMAVKGVLTKGVDSPSPKPVENPAIKP